MELVFLDNRAEETKLCDYFIIERSQHIVCASKLFDNMFITARFRTVISILISILRRRRALTRPNCLSQPNSTQSVRTDFLLLWPVAVANDTDQFWSV